jgi:hypothetical protein
MAGKLERVPDVLAVASYSILVAVMLLLFRIVFRETGRVFLGLVALVLVGTTSLMLTPAHWYSAGQPLWAGFGILAALWYSQTFRRSGRWMHMVAAALAAMFAGWCWTIGHMAGPVAMMYLWADGRRRCWQASLVPMAGTILAVALSLILGFPYMNAKPSFHGRTAREAFNPVKGAAYTLQSIPESLVLGNLGLHADTTAIQGGLITLGIVLVWQRFRRRQAVVTGRSGRGWALNTLEAAGITLTFGSYTIEWAFRCYLDFMYLRTIGLRVFVPWYDAIPQIGGVLFVVGWMWGHNEMRRGSKLAVWRLTRGDGLRAIMLSLCMMMLNAPRVEQLMRDSAPALTESERKRFPILSLQTMRANAILELQGEWQRVALRRLDRAEAVAQRMGLGLAEIRAAFGHPMLVGTYIIKPLGELLDSYDAVWLLNIPETGRKVDPAVVRAALNVYFAEDPEPRPPWLDPQEEWPPAVEQSAEKK